MKGLRSSLGLVLLVTSSLGVACGGTSTGGRGNDGGSAGAAAGATMRNGCVYDGKTYADGATFTSTDGCNACACSDGEVACDDAACAAGCTYQGKQSREGESFLTNDGCHECLCRPGGDISCTARACVSCQDAQTTHARAVDEALKCDPQASNQCLGKLTEGLPCSCGVFVNEANVEAIAAARRAAATYAAADCGGGTNCGPCATLVAGYCSQSGRCETLWQEEARPCKVGGVVYPDGAFGIHDPTSCNKCSCSNGNLICTAAHCPVPFCPAEHVFTTQCAQCGPADECLIVEHACLPTCSPDTDSCAEGACMNGVCRNLCG
jgi:hypothetical protein